MTQAQQKRLNTIIGKIEALEGDTPNKSQKEADAMRVAKSRLMEILSY